MPKQISLHFGDEVKILTKINVRVAEDNRGYVDFGEIRFVYDFDCEEIIGWYRP